MTDKKKNDSYNIPEKKSPRDYWHNPMSIEPIFKLKSLTKTNIIDSEQNERKLLSLLVAYIWHIQKKYDFFK